MDRIKRPVFIGGAILALAIALIGPALFFGLIGEHPTMALGVFNEEYSTASTRLDTCRVCRLLNPYGEDVISPFDGAMTSAGTDTEAEKIQLFRSVLKEVQAIDSDGDGHSNGAEIRARTFPGDPKDRPTATQ